MAHAEKPAGKNEQIRETFSMPVTPAGVGIRGSTLRRWKHVAQALVLSVIIAIGLTAEAGALEARELVGNHSFERQPEAQAGEGMLLFYYYEGDAMTGRIDTNGNYTGLKLHGFDPGWTNIVPTSNGITLFYNRNTGMLATAQFQADGSYQDLLTYADFTSPINPWWNVVSTGGSGVLLYSYSGVVETGRITDDGHYLRLQTHTGFDAWHSIVHINNGLMLFYNTVTGVVATAQFQADGSYQDLTTYTGFDLGWTHLVSISDNVLLFYNSSTGDAGTGRVNANGNYVDLNTYRFDVGWSSIVPVVVGTTTFVMYFQSGSNQATLGWIDAQGRHTDGPLVQGVPSLASKIVSVR